MGMEGFPAERTQVFQAPIQLVQPFPAPELRTFCGHEAFSDKNYSYRDGVMLLL